MSSTLRDCNNEAVKSLNDFCAFLFLLLDMSDSQYWLGFGSLTELEHLQRYLPAYKDWGSSLKMMLTWLRHGFSIKFLSKQILIDKQTMRRRCFISKYCSDCLGCLLV